MRSTAPNCVEGVTNWKSLARYLTAQRISKTTANSFTRLARDSYTEGRNFVFVSQHPSPTRRRLKKFVNARIILVVYRPPSEDEFEGENRFTWAPAVKYGIGVYDKILELMGEDAECII